MTLWQLDEFTPAKLLGYVREIPSRQSFQRQRFFPTLLTDDLEFEYLVGAKGKTVMASIVGFDSEAPIASERGAGAKVTGELPAIKRKARMGEKAVIRFLQPRIGSNDMQTAIDSVYTQIDDLTDGVDAVLEYLAIQALSEDAIVYDFEEGVKFRFDFGLNPRLRFNFVTGKDAAGDNVPTVSAVATGLKDTENFDLIAWLQAICSRYEISRGVRPRLWTVSATAKSLMLQNKKARDMIRGASAPTAMLTEGELQALFQIYNLPAINTYDEWVTRENRDGTTTDIRPLAENKSFFTLGEAVGNTLVGPTAEARLNLIGTRLQNQMPGLWANTWATDEPPAQWVKVAATAFPTFPEAEWVAQATLW